MAGNDSAKVAVVNSHPIQYFAPLYRYITACSDIDLTVYYCLKQGVETYEDSGFQEKVSWSTDLLSGYRYVFLTNITWSSEKGGMWSLSNPGIVSELVTNDYDLVWLHGYKFVTHLLALATAKVVGHPVAIRGDTRYKVGRSPVATIRRSALKVLYSVFDWCLAVGSLNRKHYLSHGVPDSKIVSVPYVVDNKFFHSRAPSEAEEIRAVRRKYNLPVKKPIMLFVSKMTKRKRPLDVAKAFRKLVEAGTEVSVVFVGSGEEADRLNRYIDEFNLQDAYHLGFRNQNELPYIYGMADVFILPSENEPWGLVVNEAMSCGLPVIATDEVGAAADLIEEDRNGFTYECGDIDGLVEVIERVISSRKTAMKMGRQSKAIISSWNFEACVDGLRVAVRD